MRLVGELSLLELAVGDDAWCAARATVGPHFRQRTFGGRAAGDGITKVEVAILVDITAHFLPAQATLVGDEETAVGEKHVRDLLELDPTRSGRCHARGARPGFRPAVGAARGALSAGRYR